MGTLTIRNFDDGLKKALRRRAAEHDRSMEEELRVILGDVLATPRKMDLGKAIHETFVGLDEAELELPIRRSDRSLPDFSELYEALDEEE